MGVWGVNVEDSDSFADVYEGFFDIYNNGASPKYASSEVKESFSEYFEDQYSIPREGDRNALGLEYEIIKPLSKISFYYQTN